MLSHSEILNWLHEEDPDRLEELWLRADEVRRANVGEAVHLRGLVEFSNYCQRRCGYCGLRADNKRVNRYRMSAEEILAAADKAVEFGYGTLVLQSGEDSQLEAAWLADVVRQVRARTPLAVTLSVGERSHDELALWRRAGADRYLLRFETSNRRLYEKIHPPRPGQERSDRFEILRFLPILGYQVGSGVMIGIPGQSYDDLADDVEWFAKLDLDMIGVGPFIPHPDTPLGITASPLRGEGRGEGEDGDGARCRVQSPSAPSPYPPPRGGRGETTQVPNTELMTYKVVALARLACPRANIPATTALATLNRAEGRELGLQRGANVVMPNLTPVKYRAMYEIYPAKACIGETEQDCRGCLLARVASIGRHVGVGRGDTNRAGS